ncbi:MAG: CopD family protein, partial [Aquincola tertiaricarbonis]
LLGRIARRVVQAGGNFDMPWHWWLMAVGGTLMVAIFLHVRFALFQRLRRAVTAQDWPAGGAAMAQVRQWVAVNLAIGLVIVVVVLLGGS